MNAHPFSADVIHLVPTIDGLAIREAREALGWSQAKLAAKAGTYQQMVDRIESGAVRRSKQVPAVKAALGFDTIGLIIRKARLAKGLNQTELAELVGTSQGRISSWESNADFPDGINLLRLTSILNLNLSDGPAALARSEEPQASGFPAPACGSTPSKLTELREHLEEVVDLLHALDRVGDGIGGADGYSVSAVALAAKSVADNALDAVRSMEGSR